MTASEILFDVGGDEMDGGNLATVLGFGIHSRGDAIEDLRQNARAAADCYFDEDMNQSNLIHLQFVRDGIRCGVIFYAISAVTP